MTASKLTRCPGCATVFRITPEQLAFREGHDRAIVLAQKTADAPWRELSLSQSLACEICGEVFEKLTPRHFSFGHREGACPTCDGIGRKLKFVPELIVPDPDKSVREGAIKPWRIGGKNLIIKHNALLKQLAELEEDGYLSRERDGRRNRYVLHQGQSLRHPLEVSHTVDELLNLLATGR